MYVFILFRDCSSLFTVLITLVSCFSFAGREAVYEGCQGGGVAVYKDCQGGGVAVYKGCQGGGVAPLQDQGSQQAGPAQVKQQEAWRCCWLVVNCKCRWMSLGQILFFGEPQELMVCRSDLHEIRTCVCNAVFHDFSRYSEKSWHKEITCALGTS